MCSSDLYYVAFVGRGKARKIISLRRANRRKVKLNTWNALKTPLHSVQLFEGMLQATKRCQVGNSCRAVFIPSMRSRVSRMSSGERRQEQKPDDDYPLWKIRSPVFPSAAPGCPCRPTRLVDRSQSTCGLSAPGMRCRCSPPSFSQCRVFCLARSISSWAREKS